MAGYGIWLVIALVAAARAQGLFNNEEMVVPVPHYQVGSPASTSESQFDGQVERDTLGEETPRASPGTAADLLQGIYHSCLEQGDFSCAKHKVLAFLSASVNQDKIRISRDLSIVRRDGVFQDTQENSVDVDPSMVADPERWKAARQLDSLDRFLETHELRVRVPKEVTSPEMLTYVPSFLLKNLPQEIRLPLADASEGRGRGGMLRKVIIPFLLGLKFKYSALLPIALALIALKTWKALTLGLLSIVLSAAMVIFKITKPKVLNYEIVHLPHPAPVVEHYEHHHGYGRALDAQPLAYRAYFKQ